MYKISDIQQLFPDWYKKDSELSYDDQKWLWENVKLPEEDEQKLVTLNNKIVVVNGSVSGTYKRQEDLEQKLSKHQAITKLESCGYETPSNDIASYLEILFGIWELKPKHWLYIAQRYTPKTINSVIAQMIKAHQRGDKTFQTPGAYFTSVIKFRPKRKSFRATNGAYKQGKDDHDNR